MIRVLRLVSFEAQVYMLFDVLGNTSGRSQGFEHREVVLLAFDRPAEETDAFLLGANDEVLTGMTFLLPRVVVLLFVLVLRSLNGTFGSINEDFSRFGEGLEEVLNVLELPLGQDQLFRQRGLQNAAQGELPATGVGSIAPIEKRQHIVGRIAFVVEEDEEQFVSHRRKESFPTTTVLPLPLWVVSV